jgi:hypothetical protein
MSPDKPKDEDRQSEPQPASPPKGDENDTSALGPVVPPGEEAQAPEQEGRPVTGVQPQTEDDIPESGQ